MIDDFYREDYYRSRLIHRKLNTKWLVENQFIRLTEKPLTTEYQVVKSNLKKD